MKQKLFTFFLALVANVSAIYASDIEVDGIWYDFDSNTKTASVTYQGSAYNSYTGEYSGSVIIPETVTYNGTTYSVTSIGSTAFNGCSALTSVTIPNSITSINDYAFGRCSSLTSITIPESVTSIGDGAFGGCSALTSVTIPNSVTSIGSSAFSSCSSLTSVTIPESVTSIGDYAFNGCSSLTSVTIPNSVTSIGSYAFQGCTSLTSVTIPNSVTSIRARAFYGCSALTSVTINSDAIVNKQYSLDSNLSHIFGSQVAEYVIGDNVIEIGESAFHDCSSLTSVTIVNGVTSIGDYAFDGCSSLTSVTIPNSVTSIGGYAFQGCSSLTSVTIPESVTSIGGSAFRNCSSLTSVTIISDAIVNKQYSPDSNLSHIFSSQVTEYVIGDNVIGIGANAFQGCSSLSSVTIPNSVTSIGSYAFEGCSSLTSVTIPNSVTSIGGSAFRNCSALTSVTIGNSVTSIGDYAFEGCSSLTSVTIPNSVTSIRNYAFQGCTSLKSITCEAETPATLGSWVFSGVSKSIPVYVPCGCIRAYKNATYWYDFTNIQEPLAKYSIEVNVNDTIMGSAKVDKNTICDAAQISATPNVGYHFVQWSDGVTDNPRTLELTQDTILIAEFAPNTYTITTVSSDTQRGTTQGDTTVNYLDIVTICANASYGYHFTQWNDGNSDNPRQVQVTGDTTYTATFDKNTYAISLSCNEEQGSVEGVTSAKYLDTVTISATPNIGYHFVQWSDGNTDTIRTLVLTQDTTLTAEFAQSFSGQCGASLYWELVDTTLQITGKGEMYDYKPDSAPWKLLVSSIKVLTIAEDVTMIGYDAFDGCIALVTIVWNAKHAADAYNDGQYNYPVFYGICSQIKSFTLGENVEYIPTYLCSGMDKLTSMTIPNSVTSIGERAFRNCSSLTSVTIPNSVTSIGDGAFYDCSSLTSIIIPSSVTSIGYAAFYNCTSLTSVTIPNSVTNIGDYAFNSCTSLTSVTIPESVTSIGYAAFAYCSSLASVTIPESVTSIGEYAFDGCNNITSVTWNAKNCNTYNFGSQVTSFEFGNEVEVVPSSLCKGMEKLTSVTIPNSVKTIGTSAFEGCARLGKISLGTGLEEIAANAFAGCTRLYDIYTYATYPPFADESSFANYNAYLYIPCDSKRDYTLDPVWGKFQNIECLSDQPTDMENIETPSQRPTNVQKLLRNGQLIIVRDGVEYNAMGQEL